MKGKLKKILNSLEASPEIKEKKCVKQVRQLRSAFADFETDYGLRIDTLKKRITKLCLYLQDKVSDPELINGLRTIQSECYKLYNDMNDDPGEPDMTYCWNKDDL